jgi:hypothetical protein
VAAHSQRIGIPQKIKPLQSQQGGQCWLSALLCLFGFPSLLVFHLFVFSEPAFLNHIQAATADFIPVQSKFRVLACLTSTGIVSASNQ